jgi:hypothetical protein
MRGFDESHHLSDGLFEFLVAADQVRFRKLIFEVANQSVGIVAKRHGAHAINRNRHPQPSDHFKLASVANSSADPALMPKQALFLIKRALSCHDGHGRLS